MKRTIMCMILATVAAGAGAQETTQFLVAAASAPGQNGTYWLTDARVFNPDPDHQITVRIADLRADRDNRGAAELEITVAPRRAAALDDLVGSLFGRTGSGAVRLVSASPFFVSSRTYNIGDGSSGTFGQFIPGLGTDQALATGLLLSVANDPAATGFRSNVGFVNPSSTAVSVTLRLFDLDSGELMGEGVRDLPPLAYSQINDVFAWAGVGSAVVPNASVELVAGQPVFAYASVVDNRSGDAIFVLPNPDSGTPTNLNDPPQGTISSPAGDLSIQLGASVSFVASVSDPDGDTVTGLEWDFGDDITASGLAVNHTYAAVGSYLVSFTATDEHGASDPTPATVTITVVEAAATFTDVQAQIFNVSCALSGCHASSSSSGGLDLSAGSAYGNIVGVASIQQPTLKRVEPFNPGASYLWLKVIGDPSISGSRMPRGGAPLSQDRLDLLQGWIEAGAAND